MTTTEFNPHRSRDAVWLTRSEPGPVNLKLTHLDWNPEAILIHFQGQYVDVCELDYSVLQHQIQNVPKAVTDAAAVGDFCLAEDSASACWFRGRVQNKEGGRFDVFLIDHGYVLSVGHVSRCPQHLLSLPPKLVSGFLSDVLLFPSCPHSVVGEFLLSLTGQTVSGFIKAFLPHDVVLLELPDVVGDIVRHGFGKHVDLDSFLFLVKLLTDVPVESTAPRLILDSLVVKTAKHKLSLFDLRGFSGVQPLGRSDAGGTRGRVRVSAAFSPAFFYCQWANQQRYLTDMSKRLAESLGKRPLGDREAPDNGAPLRAVRGKDGEWYRGFPLPPLGSSASCCFLIDYGFVEDAGADDVAKLPPEFYREPAKAFPCALADQDDGDEELRRLQLGFLKAGLLGEELVIEVVGLDETDRVLNVRLAKAEREEETSERREEATREPDFSHYAFPLKLMAEAVVGAQKVEQLRVGSAFAGYVEYAPNPSHFWVRTQRRDAEFQEMSRELCEHFARFRLEDGVLAEPRPGDACCALYEADFHFYRAAVTETYDDGATVLFVDFGNSETVPSVLIKRIPEELARPPPFAVCCTLANAFPLDDAWTDEQCRLFRRAVADKTLEVRVVRVDSTKLAVELSEVGGGGGIGELLMASDLAEYAVVEERQEEGKEQWDEETSGQRETETPDKRDEPGESFVYSSFGLSRGSKARVLVTHVSSQAEVYCQLESNAETLDKLQEKIQEELHKAKLETSGGGARRLCLAKYFDGDWYRALAEPVALSQQHLSVLFIDYGNAGISEASQVRRIPRGSEFLRRTPAQALRCRLRSVPAGDLYPDAKDWLSRCALNRTLTAAVGGTRDDGSLDVELLDCGTSVSEQLREMVVVLSREANVAAVNAVPDRRLAAGLRAECFVSHVDSADSFYLQLREDEPALLRMEAELNAARADLRKAAPVRAGEAVLAEFEGDGALYRAEVEAGGRRCAVTFLDYGNSAAVSEDKVYVLPEAYRRAPRLAVRCSLLPRENAELDAVHTDEPVTVRFLCRDGDRWKVKLEMPQAAESLPPPREFQTGLAAKREVNFFAATFRKRRRRPLKCRRWAEPSAIAEDETHAVLPVKPNGGFPVPEPVPDAIQAPQKLSLPILKYDKAYSGVAGAVATPSHFGVVLDDSLSEATCALRGVDPKDGGQWTAEAGVFLRRLLENKKLEIYLKDFEPGLALMVDVLVDGVHVAKRLVDAGHAHYTNTLLALRFQVESSCDDPIVVDLEAEQHYEAPREYRECFQM